MRARCLSGLLVLFLLAGCGNLARVLPSEEAEVFAAQVDGLSENLLAGLSERDYRAYTRDMDAQMLEASSEAQFAQAYETIIGRIGRYVSREMVQVVEQGQYRTVVYDARFEREEHVTVRVVFDVSGASPLVSGLWLDSPTLRGQ